MNGETTEVKNQNRSTGSEAKEEKSLDGNQEMVQTAAGELQDKLAALESQVEAKDGVITGLEGQLAKMSHDFEGAKAAYAYAVEDYKKLAASSNPLIPAEAISGTTIEEVKDSLDRALRLVANVKSLLQEGAIPAGAPARAGLDTSAMSTKEKINYGLEQARKRKE